jgi:hypothetical protein
MSSPPPRILIDAPSTRREYPQKLRKHITIIYKFECLVQMFALSEFGGIILKWLKVRSNRKLMPEQC